MIKKTTRELIKSAGLNYNFYLNQAKSIIRELEYKNPCEHYIKEKIKNVEMLFKDLKDEKARQEKINKGE